ncbi:MAG: hypothetical protein Q7R94_02700 [bacterium]|nr:hypothetical protein [bacterium]
MNLRAIEILQKISRFFSVIVFFCMCSAMIGFVLRFLFLPHYSFLTCVLAGGLLLGLTMIPHVHTKAFDGKCPVCNTVHAAQGIFRGNRGVSE